MAGRAAPTTLYVIAYDVANDRRRNKVHQILTGFGTWTQYSLFECHLSKRELLLLRAKLDRQIEPTEDNVRFYALCDACFGRVETIGSNKPARPGAYLL